MNDCADEISSTILLYIQLNGSFLLPLMLNTIDCLKWSLIFIRAPGYEIVKHQALDTKEYFTFGHSSFKTCLE